MKTDTAGVVTSYSYPKNALSKDYQFSIRLDAESPYAFENTDENKRIVAESLVATVYSPKFSPSAVAIGEYKLEVSDIKITEKVMYIDTKSIADRMRANKTDLLNRKNEIQILAKEGYDFSKLSVKIKEDTSLASLTESSKFNHRIGVFQKERITPPIYLPRDVKLTPFNLSGLKIETADICAGKTVDLKKIFSDDVEATWVEEISASEIGEKSGEVHLKYNNGLAVSGDVELKVNAIKCEDDSKKDDDKTDDNPKDEPKTDDDSKEDLKTDGDDSGKTDKTDEDSKNEITPSEIKEDKASPKISAPDTGFAGNGGILGLIGVILLATSAAIIYKIKK